METFVSLHRNFEKRFIKLDRKVKIAFLKRKNLLITDPSHPQLHNHRLSNEWDGCRSINITGDYRAIFIVRTKNHIEFLAIGTHHELYGL
ncbi:type II toxin-antitoxin system mRNA interferase toxin, RelE/StbE family [Candidatus Uhrbacteria bacterium]|nr:type II toxin-antitoxin system mRNA interferase toxin, RelE/StbE family [Candidatus Uhrbacteria bacterium]